MLTANMKLIAECADKLAHLGEKLFNETEMEKMKIGQTAEFSCPDGYIFKDEHGNVINATKIVLEKKKKEYPKTYEESLKVLGYDDREVYCIFHTGAYEILFEAFYRLKVCRDAYWKIAGNEMGKPWKPDDKEMVFSIGRIGGTLLGKILHHTGNSAILEFPTEEMRDAFYENFKDLIEQCKELL